LPCDKGGVKERLKCLSEQIATLKRAPGPKGDAGEKGDAAASAPAESK
jgi:hypothetical protein